MSIDLSATETEFQAILHRFLSERVTSEYLRTRIASTDFDTAFWNDLVDLGIFEVFSDIDNELSTSECMLLVQEFGKFLVPEAVSEQLVAGAFLSRSIARDDGVLQVAGIPVAELTAGKVGLGFPHGEVNGLVTNGAFTGSLSFIPLVSAPMQYCLLSLQDAVYLLTVTDTHCTSVVGSAVDLSRQYTHIEARGAAVQLVPGLSPILVRMLQQLFTSHEIVGLCKAVQATTIEYVKTRKQFGQPIGGFQAVQHALADMHAWIETMDALALFAAWSFDYSIDQREFACEATVRRSVERGLAFMETAIQVHGGIGFTWEYDLHLYLRRVLFYQGLFNSDRDSDSRLLQAVRKV